MNESKISVRYAKALFNLSLQNKAEQAVYNDMSLVSGTLTQSTELQQVLTNPVYKQQQKQEILKAVFHAKVHELTLSLFNLVIKNKRELQLTAICRVYIDIYKSHKNLKTVKLITASTIDKGLKEKILNMVKELYKTDIELDEQLDKNLIGGFILRIDDKQFDASLSNKLKQVKNKLLNTSVESIN